MTKRTWLAAGLLLLVVNAGWLLAFPAPNLIYVGNVVAHIGVGLALIALLAASKDVVRELAAQGGRFALLALGATALTGLALCVVGATRGNFNLVVAHAAAGFAGAALALFALRRRYPGFQRWGVIALGLAALLPAGELLRQRVAPAAGTERILNPTTAPLSMEGEGGGPHSPFVPSSSTTNVGGTIPSEFFLDSKACGECHEDIYEQWNSSMHHFSSFNNQFYRKSIEYMQETAGVQASKWCAGCHDHAMFFNGRFEQPAIEQIDTPEAQAGLGCMSCHSITSVESTMGNGGFEMTYPPLHELMTTENEVLRTINKYVINTAPAPHRKAFLKPFMREDAAEFCSSCHKVHLDKPVNNYRWFRGFNSYDNWQASGVSGHGARSFYYPAKSQTCNDCHMPLVQSDDPGNIDGFIHSHRFAAANTAVPFVNEDSEQLQAAVDNLTNDIVGVDIFAASPVAEEPEGMAMRRRTEEAPGMATTFAVGEEAAGGGAAIVLREVGEIAAPLDRAKPVAEPGSTMRVDVVIRTKKVGHFFPSGTVDSFDVWVELQAEDADGSPVFWSGRVEDDGAGPVEQGAHFYRSYMLDAHGNPIDKRNAFHARTVLYARLIPPGAADVAHFRLRVPEDVRGPLRLRAKLNYRKFAHSYTQFAYAGKANEDGEFGKDFDDRTFDFSPANIPANVSGKIKDRIPELPIITMAESQVEIPIGDSAIEWAPKVDAEDYVRWNDYGIGLLLQGDIRGAQFAFERVTEAKPNFADGWLNVARALIQEGQTTEARPYIEKALAIDSSLARIHFFKAMIEKAEGDYSAALASLGEVERQYPKDRVALNQTARLLFLERRYDEALGYLDRVARIDPEDLQMHYTAMLCYRGLGDQEKAEREQALFERFKADEDSQVITAERRRSNAEENNERQAIHDHESVDLSGVASFPSPPDKSMNAALGSDSHGGSQ
ncbi:MAG: tetratricopeptide repeat protein [Bryobacterales bacterium]